MITTRALSKLAASGDADAQFRLGYRFALGRDKRRRNLKRAFSIGRPRPNRDMCAPGSIWARVMTSAAEL